LKRLSSALRDRTGFPVRTMTPEMIIKPTPIAADGRSRQ
jgi:hypothetical protein